MYFLIKFRIASNKCICTEDTEPPVKFSNGVNYEKGLAEASRLVLFPTITNILENSMDKIIRPQAGRDLSVYPFVHVLLGFPEKQDLCLSKLLFLEQKQRPLGKLHPSG